MIELEAIPFANMSMPLGHLSNSKISDQLVLFDCDGMLQLLAASAAVYTYCPDTPCKCPPCGFSADTDLHAVIALQTAERSLWNVRMKMWTSTIFRASHHCRSGCTAAVYVM